MTFVIFMIFNQSLKYIVDPIFRIVNLDRSHNLSGADFPVHITLTISDRDAGDLGRISIK